MGDKNFPLPRFTDTLYVRVYYPYPPPAIMAYMGIGYKAMKNVSLSRFPQFVGRTVLVQNNDVEAAMKNINGMMAKEGMLKQYRLTRRYEKPYLTRRRLAYEKAKAIYDEDMSRKIKFIMRKNRDEAWIGSS